MPAAFPILAKEGLLRAAAAVSTRFDGGKATRELHEAIAMPLAEAAAAKGTPQLVGEYKTSDGNGRVDGTMTCVKARGQVFTFHRKMMNGVLELRCYEPIPAGDFKLSKLQEGGVAKLYGKKNGGDVPRITLDVGSRVRVYMWGEEKNNLDPEWARGVSEVALTLIGRAHAAAAREEDAVVEIEPGVTQARPQQKTLADVLKDAKLDDSRITPLNIPGEDLVMASAWRGGAVLVTSDRHNASPMHVLVERDLNGTRAFWPVPVPDDAAFPVKGAAAVLDGDTLHLFGGVLKDQTLSDAHWSIDLTKLPAAPWKKSASLKEPGAWAAAAVGERDAFVVGGVAGYYLKRVEKDGKSGDEKVQKTRRSMEVGGFPTWRERAAAPADITGSHALIDKSGAVFVGPGIAKDGAAVVYDGDAQQWFALPNLPDKVGMGQLHRSGRYLAYSGGFAQDGTASKALYALDLDDVFGGWKKVLDSDAVAGGARVIDRDGKKVAILVGPQGALMVHLE